MCCLWMFDHFGVDFSKMCVFKYINKQGFTLLFTRAADNNVICTFKTDNYVNTLSKAGKIMINEFMFRVPLLVLKTTSKIQ